MFKYNLKEADPSNEGLVTLISTVGWVLFGIFVLPYLIVAAFVIPIAVCVKIKDILDKRHPERIFKRISENGGAFSQCLELSHGNQPDWPTVESIKDPENTKAKYVGWDRDDFLLQTANFVAFVTDIAKLSSYKDSANAIQKIFASHFKTSTAIKDAKGNFINIKVREVTETWPNGKWFRDNKHTAYTALQKLDAAFGKSCGLIATKLEEIAKTKEPDKNETSEEAKEMWAGMLNYVNTTQMILSVYNAYCESAEDQVMNALGNVGGELYNQPDGIY